MIFIFFYLNIFCHYPHPISRSLFLYRFISLYLSRSIFLALSFSLYLSRSLFLALSFSLSLALSLSQCTIGKLLLWDHLIVLTQEESSSLTFDSPLIILSNPQRSVSQPTPEFIIQTSTPMETFV